MSGFISARLWTGGRWGVASISVLAMLSFGLPLCFAPTTTFPPSDLRSGYQSGSNRRSTLDIVWDCVSTISICVYTAVHKTIPEHPRSRFRSILDKAAWVLLGISSPEYILGKAGQEYYKAVIITREMQQWELPSTPSASQQWTYTHSFFLLMRGFQYQGGRVLDLHHLAWLRQHIRKQVLSYSSALLSTEHV